MKLCQENEDDKICYEKQVLPDSSDKVTDFVANLKMCSTYVLDIFPLYRKSEIKTKTVKFRTKSPVQNPANVQISVDGDKDKIKFEWKSVECAAGYKVLQKLQKSDSEHSEDADWTFLTMKSQLEIDSPEPCTKLRLNVHDNHEKTF